MIVLLLVFFFSSSRRHTSLTCDWSSDVCSSDLGLERVALRHLALLQGERRLPVEVGLAPADAHAALAVVDRQVGVGLEDAYLALALHGDAARGHVGDAAVGEAEPRIRDVDRGGEDRDAHRL